MIDPITATIVAGSIGAVNAGSTLLSLKRQKRLEEELKRQRIELTCFEIGLLTLATASIIDILTIRKLIKTHEMYRQQDMANTTWRINELDRRINNLNLDALDAKLDIVVAATANPRIIPVAPQPEEKAHKIRDTKNSEED